MTELQVKTKKGSLKKFFAMFLAVCVSLTTIQVNAAEHDPNAKASIILNASSKEMTVGEQNVKLEATTAKKVIVTACDAYVSGGDGEIVVSPDGTEYVSGDGTIAREGNVVVDAEDADITWKSSDPTVVTVPATGKSVTLDAKKAGSATITAKIDENTTATCTVTVKPATVSVTGVTLNKPSLPLTVGGSEKLTATVAPANASNKAVEWKSDKPAVATVDANGTVKAVAVGEATITVTTKDGNKTATCKVTVTAAPPTTVSVTGVTLNKTKATVNVGKTVKLTATVAPANATVTDVTWKTSNKKVATVTNGTVKGVAKGTAKITVTTKDGSKTATCTVTVKKPVTSIALNTKTLYVVASKKDTKLTVGAAVVPADASVQTIAWKSNKKAVTVKAVSKSKGSAATITVKKNTKAKTKATITASADGKKATIAVNVVAKAKKTTSVKLSKKTLSMNTGAKYALTATLSTGATSTVKWSTSDKKVATVANGVVTAKSAGKVTITATADKKTAKCVITVTKAGAKVTLQKTKATIKVKKTTTIKIKSPKGDTISKCTSSNKKVATVTNKGKVTGKKAGKADITVVTTKGAVATFKVTVK